MIAKTALLPAIAAESPRKDEGRTELGEAGFGSLLEDELRDPRADAAPGGPATTKAPGREGAAEAPTAAVLRCALEARPPPATHATATDGEAPRAIPEGASEPSDAGANEDETTGPAPPANPPPVAQAPTPAAPLPISVGGAITVAPSVGGDGAKARPETDRSSSTDEAKATRNDAAIGDHVPGAAVRAPSRGASRVVFAAKTPTRAKFAGKGENSHPSPDSAMAAGTPPATAQGIAQATATRAIADQAHAASDLSPRPGGARTALPTASIMQNTHISAPRSEAALDDPEPTAAAAGGAQEEEALGATPAHDESTDLPRNLTALRTAIAAPLENLAPWAGGAPTAHAAASTPAAPAAPNAPAPPSAGERPLQQKPTAEPARSAGPHDAPRAAGSTATSTAVATPPATPGAPSEHAGAGGRERPAAPERMVAADGRAPTSTTVSDKVRPDVDARAERPVPARAGATEAAEPARGATPVEMLPAGAPMVKDAPASAATATAAALSSLRHEPVAPSVNVVTLAAATRSEVDIPELGRIVIAAERRRNRVDLEIHAAEPATVQLLREKAPEMLHEVNRVANVAAVNVQQSKTDEAGRPGASGSAPRGSEGSAGSGGHGARKDQRAPAEERSEAEISGPLASAAGRVRFVL